jgi:Phosphoesterase family
VFSIGYFEADDLGFYGHAARDWTVCDRYFAAMMAPTFPNRFFLHSAQTDRTTTSVDKLATMPAIWDRLADNNVTGRYFFTDVPYTALWGTRYLGISRPIPEFYAAAALGALPAVSFVEPGFLGEAVPGLSQDEHPLADIRLGQHFLATVYNAVVSSPNWARTMLIITAGRAGSQPGPRRRTAGVPGAVRGDLAAGPARGGGARAVRPHLGAEADRVAVRAGAADGPGRRREQPGRGARLRQPATAFRAAVQRAAADHLRLPAHRPRAQRRGLARPRGPRPRSRLPHGMTA